MGGWAEQKGEKGGGDEGEVAEDGPRVQFS